MALDKCVSDVAAELGMSEERVRGLADQLVAARAKLEGQGRGSRVEQDLRDFARDKANTARQDAARTRKAAASDVAKLAVNRDWFRAQQAAGIGERDMAIARLVGDVRMPDSAWRDRVALKDQWASDLSTAAHERVPVVFDLLRRPVAESKPFFDDVVRELAELRDGGKPGVTGNKDARELAGIVREFQEARRIEAGHHGIRIEPHEGAAAPMRLHEGELIRAGEDKFVADAIEHLDLDRMFPGTPLFGPEGRAIVAELRARFYDAIHGRDAAEALLERGGLSEMSANIAKRLGDETAWRFKDADSWIRFNDLYGRGHVMDGLFADIERSARDIGLVGKFGSNPEANYRTMLATMQRELSQRAERGEITNEDAAKRIAALQWEGPIKNAWEVVSGRSDITTDVDWANGMRTFRQAVVMAKLGGSMLSQFSDLATFAQGMSDQGRGLFQGHMDALHGLLTGGNEQVARACAVTADAFTNDIHLRFSTDDLKPGFMSKAIESFYKWSGVKWWTERLEKAYATLTSWWMAQLSGKSFDELPPAYRHLIGLHGITPSEWSAVAHSVAEVDGERYALPGNLRTAPAEAFGGLEGQALDRARRGLELKLRGFFADEAHYGVIKGDDRTKLFMTRGTRAGTVTGEAIRTMGQFSSFSVAYGQRVMQRQLRGYAGADPGKGIMKSIPGALAKNWPALANVIVASTVYGALSMTAKDWSKNRTMKDWQGHPKAFLLAAMAQGGGLGIYGDFFLGQVDRYGGTLTNKFAGPGIGTVGDLIDLAMKSRNRLMHPGEAPGPDDVKASDFIRFGLNNNPIWPMNLWYTKAAMDLAIMNRLEEWASPGTFRRRAAGLRQQTGQGYLVAPLAHGTSP